MTSTVTQADALLTRSELNAPGIQRRRSGRGFRYLATDGAPLTDEVAIVRIKTLVIPPAGEEVWICPHEDGHIQAAGTDVAGRRQYRYHDRWREQQDREKFDRMLEFGRALPAYGRRSNGICRDRIYPGSGCWPPPSG
jgi:DNA topoisomerase IB